jgi:hypothetical protein
MKTDSYIKMWWNNYGRFSFDTLVQYGGINDCTKWGELSDGDRRTIINMLATAHSAAEASWDSLSVEEQQRLMSYGH